MLDRLFGSAATDLAADSEDWSLNGWKHIPEHVIPLDGLEPGQDWLDDDFVDELEHHPDIRPYGGDRPIWVIRHHGRLVINDGHHRVAAARAHGQHTIRARIRTWRRR